MNDIKNAYVLPARGNGKSMYSYYFQELIYKMLKGEIPMSKEIENFMVKNFNMPIVDDITIAGTVEPTPEEWVWVKGYKGTDAHMHCKGYRYELGKQFDMPENEEVNVCYSGFHLCSELRDVFSYYPIADGNRFFEVKALIRKSDVEPESFTNRTGKKAGYCLYDNHKYAAKSIKFIRELSMEEVFEAYAETNKTVVDWTDEQKKKAIETSVAQVRREIHTSNLIEAGYSEAFATYLARDIGDYDLAMALASQPGVSMDVKVMAIFMNNDN